MSYKRYFARALDADPERLHFAAHSHHLWPDVSFDAHVRAWDDAARLADRKWDVVFGEIVPEAQAHVARIVGLPDPTTVVFAPNTHELVMRIWSCLPADRAVRVLTTDAEFHSFRRQTLRFEEAGRAKVERVAAEPFSTFASRFATHAASGEHELVYLSHVFFDSAFVVCDLAAIVEAVPDPETFAVIDAYHGFMAIPTDLAPLAQRAFYLGGGYKYAMSGEGVCFAHCPPGYGARPVDTGWFAGFEGLPATAAAGAVAYPTDGARFLGATLDPSALYRFGAVMRWLLDIGVTVADIHRHVRALQERFLDGLEAAGSPLVEALVPERGGVPDRGNFLTLRLPEAADLHRRLLDDNVVTDVRGDRLRIGFGVYHDPEDVDELVSRLRHLALGAGVRPNRADPIASASNPRE
ncbi:MAG: aminotransferase class V-fold PLP-dependent enzyme [Acidimicrobiales bacterium]